ncbi:MAG: YidC/Oxa1 family membrane protein insertase [Bacillota bacterium]|nr:YidC/Oxa1 family membrane protein insertase [Bacillota bacterium]MDW7684292.1 YidC/Oxa1 family membrane protein insertase [Bacillota bacterium]
MITAIREYLNMILLFFDGFTGNYGISIILLTILIRLLTWPLTNKQLSSAKAMQDLQPEVKKLQEKYKNDKEKLNAATMELWKTNKVNPLTGCLPLLIQMPILWAMFQVLREPPANVSNFMLLGIDMRISVFALREAGQTFAISSAGYYLLVILSGVTTWLQQKLMMTDKSQQTMMIFMPLMLLYFSLQFPAGLVLYWVFNNLLSIAHHLMLNKKPAKGAVTE